MISQVIQKIKSFGKQKKDLKTSNSKNEAFTRLQWVTKRDRARL